MPSGPLSQDPHERGLAELRHLRDRGDRALPELPRGHGPDAPQSLDRQPVQERDLAVDRHDEQAVGLGHAAGHLRQELRPRHAHRHADADPLEHGCPQVHRDLSRRAGDPAQPADVQERLVDRESLHERRGVVEDREHRLARLAVRLHPRPNDDRLRAQASRLRLAHRRPDAERLGLVAGREHDAASDDHGTAAQRWVVPLFDRRVEGVGVGVQDRALVPHRSMLAPATDIRTRRCPISRLFVGSKGYRVFVLG